MASFTIEINISASDISLLKKEGYSLYAFKAVCASGYGGITVWNKLNTDDIVSTNKLVWDDDYEAYNSISVIKDRNEIVAGNVLQIKLGDLVSIDSNGNISNSKNGIAKSISYINHADKVYTIGYSQKVEENMNMTCAFSILGGNAGRTIAPVNKVALIFSTLSLELATVIGRAVSSGIIIDLNGGQNNTRQVTFSTTNGWLDNTESWVENFSAFEDLTDLLIQEPIV